MSAGLAEKPLDRRPLRMVADWRMIFAPLSSSVKMSVAAEAGTCFFLVAGGSASSWWSSAGFFYLSCGPLL